MCIGYNGDPMQKKHYIILGTLIALVMSVFFSRDMIADTLAVVSYQPLSGVTVVLDPGHGGKDNGAMSGDIHEQDINLAIAQKLQDKLQEAGASVQLTREGNYDLAKENAVNRKREDMKKRVAMINEDQPDVFLSIHLNAYPNASVKGAQAFYKKDDAASKQLADIIQSHLQELTGKKLSSKTGDYYILNETKKPGVLVECGFLSNAEDRELLVQESYQEKVAETLCQSILEYFQMLI